MIHASTPISFFAAIQAKEEPRRHECEVRYVAAFGTDERRTTYLEAVRKERGRDAAVKLRQDVWTLMSGHPGNHVRQEALFA